MQDCMRVSKPSHREHSLPTKMRFRCKLMLWLAVWTSVAFLVFNLVTLTFNPDKYSERRDIKKSFFFDHFKGHDEDDNPGNDENKILMGSLDRRNDTFLIDTPGCRVTNNDINHPSIQGVVKQLPPFVCPCSSGKGLTHIRPNHTISVNPMALKSVGFKFFANLKSDFYCCIWNMFREQEEDDDNILRFPPNCTRFRDSIQAETDYVKIECFADGKQIYETYHVVPMRHAEVEERSSLAIQQEQPGFCPKGKTEDRLSILFLIVDSASRIGVHRNLKDSYRYLVEDLGAIEMDAYSRISDNTFPNFVPLMAGVSQAQLRKLCWPKDDAYFDDCKFLWNEFAEAGYRTAFLEDQPDIGVFHFQKKGFRRQPTDYYGHAFFKQASKLSFFQNDCLNDIMETEHLLKWGHDLKALFRKDLFFGIVFESRYTHEDVNKFQYVDGPLSRYLRKFKDGGLLDNTLLIVMGDHGLRFGAYRETELGSYEVNLPSSILVFPPEFRRRHRRLISNVRHNARNRLVTHYDIHETLKEVLQCSYLNPNYPDGEMGGSPPWPRGISLFKRIPDSRTCADAGIPTEYCPCKRSTKPLDVGSPHAQISANMVVKKLNGITEKHRTKCAEFKLGRILGAKAIEMSNPKMDWDELIFEVTIEVQPGRARFQGTALHFVKSNTTFAQPGISRLNMYGNSSACITGDATLRKYCFCV